MSTHYLTTRQVAEKWNISERRVRTLCHEGKIDGVTKVGRAYRIPEHATKPADGRAKEPQDHMARRYLKWNNEVIGFIDAANQVTFTKPLFNEVVALYTRGAKTWTPDQFIDFLTERMVNSQRRDIERILFRCGLSRYDVLRLADITRAINSKDLLWIAHNPDELLEETITEVFDSVFHHKIDEVGESIDTPEGYNIKRYGVHEGHYGIFKKRISPLATDVESEIAVHLLAEALGVRTCPVSRIDEDTVFSEFLYDFAREYIVHFRRLFDGQRSDDEYQNLLDVRPDYADDIARMILLDFITRQDDRHLSNIALKMGADGESFYPLYDNGRSLFYEDTEEMVTAAISDPNAYSTSFGFRGTYHDYVHDIAQEYGGVSDLVNLDISREEVYSILTKAGFKGYRFDGALAWILQAIEVLKQLS